MPTCKECAGTGKVCQGLDEAACTKCPPDLAAIRSLVVDWKAADDLIHNLGFDASAEREKTRNVELLLDRYEELVAALEPAEWQTPLQRANELKDNLVITRQIKILVTGEDSP